MIELERTKTLLSDFGLTSAQDLLESQLERSIQKEDTYLGFLSSLWNWKPPSGVEGVSKPG